MLQNKYLFFTFAVRLSGKRHRIAKGTSSLQDQALYGKRYHVGLLLRFSADQGLRVFFSSLEVMWMASRILKVEKCRHQRRRSVGAASHCFMHSSLSTVLSRGVDYLLAPDGDADILPMVFVHLVQAVEIAPAPLGQLVAEFQEM